MAGDERRRREEAEAQRRRLEEAAQRERLRKESGQKAPDAGRDPRDPGQPEQRGRPKEK